MHMHFAAERVRGESELKEYDLVTGIARQRA